MQVLAIQLQANNLLLNKMHQHQKQKQKLSKDKKKIQGKDTRTTLMQSWKNQIHANESNKVFEVQKTQNRTQDTTPSSLTTCKWKKSSMTKSIWSKANAKKVWMGKTERSEAWSSEDWWTGTLKSSWYDDQLQKVFSTLVRVLAKKDSKQKIPLPKL